MTVRLGHDEMYFNEREIRLDQRGTLLIDAHSHWGYYITVITLSHSVRDWDSTGMQSVIVDRPVIVERGAWICSKAVLYNCTIREGAIVAIGAVVRSQEVGPFVMVAGNPARVIARFIEGQWIYDAPRWEVLK
jgi:acetyltransferase-like isoleucine patch superfamily enzyme